MKSYVFSFFSFFVCFDHFEAQNAYSMVSLKTKG